MIKSIFFDFDGVILDTVAIKGQVFGQLFNKWGDQVVKQIIEHHNANGGMPRFEKIKNMYIEILKKQITDCQVNNLCNQYSRIVFNQVLSANWIPGVKDFINKYYKKYKFFIISATPQTEINEIVRIKSIEPYFLEVLGTPITKSEHIEYLINKYGIKRSEVFFIGDSIHDYKAAENCRIKFLGIVDESSNCFPKNISVYPDFYELNHHNDMLDILR